MRRGGLGTGLLLAGLLAALPGCAGRRPAASGVVDGRLAPCPRTPNCVGSDETRPRHQIAPFELAAPPDRAWRALREELSRWPRTRIVRDEPGYLHAECASRVFRFVDDLELHLRPAEGRIAVRSASRIGYSDLGVNRRRVEALREALRARGVVR